MFFRSNTVSVNIASVCLLDRWYKWNNNTCDAQLTLSIEDHSFGHWENPVVSTQWTFTDYFNTVLSIKQAAAALQEMNSGLKATWTLISSHSVGHMCCLMYLGQFSGFLWVCWSHICLKGLYSLPDNRPLIHWRCWRLFHSATAELYCFLMVLGHLMPLIESS